MKHLKMLNLLMIYNNIHILLKVLKKYQFVILNKMILLLILFVNKQLWDIYIIIINKKIYIMFLHLIMNNNQ
jgi:hypothetical protein